MCMALKVLALTATVFGKANYSFCVYLYIDLAASALILEQLVCFKSREKFIVDDFTASNLMLLPHPACLFYSSTELTASKTVFGEPVTECIGLSSFRY